MAAPCEPNGDGEYLRPLVQVSFGCRQLLFRLVLRVRDPILVTLEQFQLDRVCVVGAQLNLVAVPLIMPNRRMPVMITT